MAYCLAYGFFFASILPIIAFWQSSAFSILIIFFLASPGFIAFASAIIFTILFFCFIILFFLFIKLLFSFLIQLIF